MVSPARYVLAPVVVLATLGLAGLSLLEGVIRVGPVGSILLLPLDTGVLLWLGVAFFGIGLVLYADYFRREDGSRLVSDGRPVEAVVPVHDDAGVLHKSVEHLVASEYGNLSITVVAEPDDEASIDRAEELAAEHPAVECLVNEARPGSKAGAINTAIERSGAAVIALFDADQQPHPKLVPHAMAYLDDDDIARVRNMPDPSGGVVESMAYYEYLLLFFLPQKVARFVLGFNLAGTRSILLNRAVFETVGTFNEDTLTEDLEFTHRIHRSDLTVRELLHYPTLEEPAHTMRDWWGQRVRWMTGQVEVGDDHLREWRNLLDREFLGSVATLVGTFVAGAVMATLVPKVALGLATDPLVVGGGLAGVYAVSLATRWIDNRRAALKGFGGAWVLLPVALTLYGLVILQAVVEYVLGFETGWYSVEKADAG